MLKLFSGIASRVVRLVPRPDPAPRWTQTPGRWPPHSALRGLAGVCRCYDCHLARESRKAPKRAERAVRRCHEKMEELRAKIAAGEPLDVPSPGGPGAPEELDWDRLIPRRRRATDSTSDQPE